MKCGFTIKKAKYFSRPNDLEDKVKTFIAKREIFKSENRPFQDFELPKGAVILLDNVRFHHSKIVKEFAETCGFELL